MNEHTEPWVVEYSVSQGMFHVELLSVILRENLDACLADRPTDYVIVDICSTYRKAHDVIAKIRDRKVLRVG